MKKLNATGFKISSVDKKALDHYLLVSPLKWSQDAIAGMKNKAIKTILKDWFELYKSKQEESVSANIAVIIPAIIAMSAFKPYNTPTPDVPFVNRKESATQEIWEDGFDVEDYEEAALRAFYANPEAMLEYFMENKIYQRRKAFKHEQETLLIADNSVAEIPSNEDDFINFVCARDGYKNRSQLEEETLQA